jgi:uncharacterized protein YegP (UPF0339 family)
VYRLKLYKDRQGYWRWRLLSRNRRIIANCGEGYRRKIDCLRIAEAILQGNMPYTLLEGEE